MDYLSVLSEMNANGVFPDSIIADGQIKRFKVNADDSGKAGWYVAYETGVVVYGDFKRGFKKVFKAPCANEAEQIRQNINVKDALKKFSEQKKIEHLEIAKLLTRQWHADGWSNENAIKNPYFLKKKLDQVPNIKIKDGVIYVPAYQNDSDLIWSFQRIFPDGKKKFTANSKAKGGFFIIDGKTDVVYLCEGFATAVTIKMATDAKVICCFSAGGLVEVAKHLPVGNYVIAADDDRWSGENAGRKFAKQAAHFINAKIKYPEFNDLSSKPTDFNDLLCLEGIEAVKSQLMKVDEVVVVDDISFAPMEKSVLIEKLPHWKWSRPYGNKSPEPVFPLSTIENLKCLLEHLGIVARYNVISKQEEILIPNKSFTIDNEAVACLAWIKSFQSRISMPTTHVGEYLTTIAEQNPYNPVATWITSKKWDGTSRLEDFFSTIVAENEDTDEKVLNLKKTLMKRWAVSAVAAAFLPKGISAHGVLVLQGEQYIGKTAWLKSLAPKDLDVIADGKILKPDDKDSVNQAIRYWIVELGELDATFRKADMAQLKAFLTKDSDLLRRAFAPKDSRFARRTIFFASVNPKQFLHDPTGNRRFWTIECKKINYSHGLDMQQIWAEFYELYLKGEPWVLTYEEMTQLNNNNEAFLDRDVVEELVASKMDWNAHENSWTYMTSSAVLKLLGIERPRQAEKSKATQAILRLNGSRKRIRRGFVELFVPPDIVPVHQEPENGKPTPPTTHNAPQSSPRKFISYYG